MLIQQPNLRIRSEGELCVQHLLQLPQKHAARILFSLPHVAATQEIRESFLTLTATMVVKPTPPFCLLAATTIAAAAWRQQTTRPEKPTQNKTDTFPVCPIPCSWGTSSRVPRLALALAPRGRVSFLAKLSPLAKNNSFRWWKIRHIFLMDLSVVSAFKKYYFDFFFPFFPPRKPPKDEILLVLKYFRHFQKIKNKFATSRPR